MKIPDVSKPFNLILFGAAGDLAHRKLLPALFNLYKDGRLNENGHIWAITRPSHKEDEYLGQVKHGCFIMVRTCQKMNGRVLRHASIWLVLN